MKAVCVLCDRSFLPNSYQAKKLRKHPHRIFLCPTCHQRIAEQTLARKEGDIGSSHRKRGGDFPDR
ncbi:uncharacterized protein YlaI [Melghirimyces profundicolus]|uniref:Uncharacterized protein YlaI n=1 Tax=Melghirimyces profundicolus TaxID=1242148 RepID=A0A2T6C9S6_9BACL|nr:DUF2197 domain-containing protein [Melghirimyces profundicolus]PTX65067.1 uncharacterized protein YlaI [Melghirimyces profundicolus]